MEKLIEILTSIGLSPIWALDLVILASILSFLLRKYIDLKAKLKETDTSYQKERLGKIDERMFQ